MIICYKYPAPKYDTALNTAGVHGRIFVVYDDRTGEALFFQLGYDTSLPAEDVPDIIPFTRWQMNVVNGRYLDWCAANPDKAVAAVGGAMVRFDREAHEDFMRNL